MAWISGVACTEFGRLPGLDALGWQSRAALAAIADAGLEPAQVDGLLAGYATTLRHLMPANLLAEYLGVKPTVAFGVSAGGATGLSMVATAAALVDSGSARTVLVVGGENRASGQSSDTSIETLAQVGHSRYEVPLGANVPAYYALLASHYLHSRGLDAANLSPLAVQMRRHAITTPGAHFTTPITESDVLSSPLIADPLRLLDCCPISDGGAAFVITDRPRGSSALRIAGVGQAHRHQHVSEADLENLGAASAAHGALSQSGWTIGELDTVGIYDSFTVTLAMLLEEIGICERGKAGSDAAAGRFERIGTLPLNTHGGLLSYGHCGVAGGMAHLAEVSRQLRNSCGSRQITRPARRALVHADGGVMSAHVSLAVERP